MKTTSTLMTWLLYALALQPEVDAKLFDELNSHADFLKERSPTHAEIRELDYLYRVIEETLRVYSPVPLLARRAVHDTTLSAVNTTTTDSKDHPQPPQPASTGASAELGIKKGMLVIMNTYSIHRDVTHWTEPLTFNPDRFTKEVSKGRDKFSWNPFSHGPRHCIGQEFALLEARSLLSQILVRYRFTLPAGHEVKKKVMVVLRPQTPILMHVHRR